MKLQDFDFDLPEDRIALRPVRPRGAARLLVQDGPDRHHVHVVDLPRFLRDGDLLVFNDTKVIPARLSGERHRDALIAKVELTLTQDLGGGTWRALARPARKLHADDRVVFGDGLAGRVLHAPVDGQVDVAFDLEGAAFMAALAEAGVMPLPPYIASKRPADERDTADYQPVFATREGAIAAPTASLHFDDGLLGAVKARGVDTCFVTLHVGIGTFLPVKVDNIDAHVMHAEWGEVRADVATRIAATKAAGGRVIAVGTTALRLLESALNARGDITAFAGETDIFITPGYRFRVVDGLMTNFHLPQSTLLMLVAGLIGFETMKSIYADATAREYRFFSYGDASLLLPEAQDA